MFARKLIATLSEPIHVNGNRIHLGTSVGISYSPGDADTVENLLDYADMAMYEAKHAGKNQFKVYSQVDDT